MDASSRWLRIAGSLMLGLFVGYLDRINLSVALPDLTAELNVQGAIVEWILSVFLIGYCIAHIVGGIFTRKYDPKNIAVITFLIWSIATLLVGFTHSVILIIACRIILGLAEGVYWPQMSRISRDWFSEKERTRANTVILYYGQFLALGFGFMILKPIVDHVGWRETFIITGMIGIVIIVPLYMKVLKKQKDAPFYEPAQNSAQDKITWQGLGGKSILLLIVAYVLQGMYFWGITLWIPMIVRELKFSGFPLAIASSMPFLACILFAIPISAFSDKTRKRALIAGFGIIVAGCSTLFFPSVTNPYVGVALLSFAMAIFQATLIPNIFAIIQTNVKPSLVGVAHGIIGGIGAGGGGTIAGLLVGYIQRTTGSFMYGIVFLSVSLIIAGICILFYGKLKQQLFVIKEID